MVATSYAALIEELKLKAYLKPWLCKAYILGKMVDIFDFTRKGNSVVVRFEDCMVDADQIFDRGLLVIHKIIIATHKTNLFARTGQIIQLEFEIPDPRRLCLS